MSSAPVGDAVALAIRLARELMATTDRPILGVGVGSPGVVDPSGVVVEAANLGWHDLPLARELSTALDLPVHVVNDANAATLGRVRASATSRPTTSCS